MAVNGRFLNQAMSRAGGLVAKSIAIDAYLAKIAKGVLQISVPTITVTYTCKSTGLMLPIASWF